MSITKLYHGTTAARSESIVTNGLPLEEGGVSYWGSQRIAEWYATYVADEEGSTPVVIEKEITEFNETLFVADENSIKWPMVFTLDTTEEEVSAAYEGSDKSWQSTYDIVESVIYTGTVSVSASDVVASERVVLPGDADYVEPDTSEGEELEEPIEAHDG